MKKSSGPRCLIKSAPFSLNMSEADFDASDLWDLPRVIALGHGRPNYLVGNTKILHRSKGP